MRISTIKANRNPVGIPRVQSNAGGPSDRSNGPSIFMIACCALMVVGFAIVFATVPATQSWIEKPTLALPLLACAGVHLVMHRFMGRACHDSGTKPNSEARPSNQTNMKTIDG